MVFGKPWMEHIGYNDTYQKLNNDWGTGAKVAAIIGVTGATVMAWPVALAAAGWTASGVVAGSFAATIQAGIGNVAAGSAFAVAQSAAMSGAVAGTINTAIVGAGTVVAGTVVGGSVAAHGGDCAEEDN
ncbi:hypothetical protein N0V90_011013 [Kalmusia sp. IMI 367209]|nr:hypothetical protein N0V90_011013 [Kalmusia sp. IMI 367209]